MESRAKSYINCMLRYSIRNKNNQSILSCANIQGCACIILIGACNMSSAYKWIICWSRKNIFSNLRRYIHSSIGALLDAVYNPDMISIEKIMIKQLAIVKNIDYQKYHNNTETLKRLSNAHRTQKINVNCMTFNSLTF